MRRWVMLVFFLSATWAAGSVAIAQDTGAMSNGNWNDPTIWTAGTVPGSSNNVYIGSTYPSGSALIATVTLTQNQSANNVYVGSGNNTSGTLDLGTNTLTISSTLTIGQNGGLGSIVEGVGGSFTAPNLNIESTNAFTFGGGDQVANLSVYSASSGTTSATGNVTGNVNVLSGSTLNLGANLSISGSMDVENTGSVVHMNGNNISAATVLLGWYDGQPVTLDRGTTPGSLMATNLYVGTGSTFNFISSDSVSNLTQSGATVTTAAVGNVTGNVNVDSGSTLNLGANLSLTGSLDVEQTGSVVHMNGNNISAATILLGWYDGQGVTLDRGTTPGSHLRDQPVRRR